MSPVMLNKAELSDQIGIPGDESVASFYHLREDLRHRCCRGLACFAARENMPARWAQAARASSPVYCLGKCYVAPASTEGEERPRVESHARRAVLLSEVGKEESPTLARYRSQDGEAALAIALRMTSAQLCESITESGLRGRGGAGFPAGRKWAAVAEAAGSRKVIVANADEGDPGSFSDRFLLEDDPFRLLDGMLIAAHAVGASQGYIYLRKEYPEASLRLREVLSQANAARLLGANALGAGREFNIELVVGEGSYLCGEETAMLNAIEGKRPEARTRPPFIFERGLFNAPTLVHNIETLCAVPWIIKNGAEAYAELGFSKSRGTKLLSLGSTFNRPGLYEVEFGITLRSIVEDIGGGLKDRSLRALMIGGPLAGMIPPALLDTRFGYEELQAIGAAVGHGGVIAFGTDTSIAEIAYEVFRFGAFESCGKCVPCHRGSPVLERAFAAASAHQRLDIGPKGYANLIHALEAASLCGHGRGLAEFARSLERHFSEELAACFA